MRVPLAPLLLSVATTNLPEYLDDLQYLVNIDSGSYNGPGVNKVADRLAQRLTELGCAVERTAPPAELAAARGDTLIARRTGTGRGRVLLIGHLDTVFADGTAERRPYRVDDRSRAYGPGVTDDKAGALAGIYALRALTELGVDNYAELVLCFSPDEEIGSPTARPHIERLAAGADAVLSLECAREDGSLVNARKAIADVHIRISGRAAHAGIEPERGADAARAAAELVLALHRLAQQRSDIALNVGIVQAGTRVNVVCDEALLGVEVRSSTDAALSAALADIAGLLDRLPVAGTTAELTVSGHCPAMPAGPANAALVELAKQLAGQLGFEVAAVASGGVADANYAAATGTPTLDGLGPVGGADHSPAEWLDIASIASRIALLAGMMAELGARAAQLPDPAGEATR